MGMLRVRDLDDIVLQHLVDRAKANGNSLDSEAGHLLARVIRTEKESTERPASTWVLASELRRKGEGLPLKLGKTIDETDDS